MLSFLHTLWSNNKRSKFPAWVKSQWLTNYPDYTENNYHECELALLQYFKIVTSTKYETLLPSAAADSVWHIFLTNPEQYTDFCNKYYGRHIRHIEKNKLSNKNSTALEITFSIAAKLEKNNIAKTGKLPLIFSLDRNLQWTNGFYYFFNNGNISYIKPNSDLPHNFINGSDLNRILTGIVLKNGFFVFQKPIITSQQNNTSRSSCGGDTYFTHSSLMYSNSNNHSSSTSSNDHHSSSVANHDDGGSSCGGGCGGD